MKNSASKSTAVSAKKVVSELERQDRQSTLLEFMQSSDAGKAVDMSVRNSTQSNSVFNFDRRYIKKKQGKACKNVNRSGLL